jgi:large subunit ribosomal protein L23
MGLDSVLVITDTVDENLYLASRNLPNVRSSSRATLIRCRWSTSRRCWSPRRRSPRSRSCHERIRKNDHRLMQVLLAPVISEKATLVADKNEQVVFEVAADATKPEVKAAVELLFKVEVSRSTCWSKGKQKRFGRFDGRRKDVKKAYVCLKPGQEINFAAEAK